MSSSLPPRDTICYTVHEQYPHRDVVTFYTMKEAEDYLIAHANELMLPVITTRRFYDARPQRTSTPPQRIN